MKSALTSARGGCGRAPRTRGQPLLDPPARALWRRAAFRRGFNRCPLSALRERESPPPLTQGRVWGGGYLQVGLSKEIVMPLPLELACATSWKSKLDPSEPTAWTVKVDVSLPLRRLLLSPNNTVSWPE